MKREKTFAEQVLELLEKYTTKANEGTTRMEIIKCKGKRTHAEFNLRELNHSLLNRSLQP